MKNYKTNLKNSVPEIAISSPTNFTHVTGTAKLNLISLDAAKARERAFYGEKPKQPDHATMISKNVEAKEMTTEDELGLKDGWIKLLDAKTKKFYYHNEQLQLTQWEKP